MKYLRRFFQHVLDVLDDMLVGDEPLEHDGAIADLERALDHWRQNRERKPE